MTHQVVIVESPTKARTIQKYLGKKYEICASYGHVRDLIAKKGAVEPDKNFAMRYIPVSKNQKVIAKIREAIKKANTIYLATDPDREGEAIAWHICELFKEEKVLKKQKIYRVTFNEFTRNAIEEAFKNPRELSLPLIHAQQARRALDHLVGFNLSPLLWEKIFRGLSAGRVQSPALILIIEREEAIKAFISQEYWTLHANLMHANTPFQAKLITYQGQKLEQFTIHQASQAQEAKQFLLNIANGKLQVIEVSTKNRKRNPAAPFITSTLQQEAARKLGFSPQRTMRIAQQLYEGVSIDSESMGLITYMRTDSVHLSKEAIEQTRSFIESHYGKEYLSQGKRVFRTTTKNAQEAHEAIRPTRVDLTPDKAKVYLTPEQFRLYELIWKRTIASQMIHALFNAVSIDLGVSNNIFRATGSTILHPGFMAVYQEDRDDEKEEEHKLLPPLQKGETVLLEDILTEQHFTEPPPRYTEASLIKALEEYGIGRPSTYATILSTLQQRDYVHLEQKRFQPTDIGYTVAHFLKDYFSTYVDYSFTAHLENTLDAIARGEKEYIPVLKEFWEPFKNQVYTISEKVKRQDVTQEKLEEACPQCQKPLSIRLGKKGRFIGCTNYPDCHYTRNLESDTSSSVTSTESSTPTPTLVGRACPDCQSPLIIKQGRTGSFIGCSHYPACKHIEPLIHEGDVGCPQCKKGYLIERKSRYGKFFYACSAYPKCNYTINYKPISEPCPSCKWPIRMLKVTKREGTQKVCPQKDCNFTERVLDDSEH